MKRFTIIICLLATFLFCQERSVIFNTGSPDNTIGHLIDTNHSVANRISIGNDYVLEAMVFYMTAENIEGANVKISIRQDNNGIPGELVSELAEWNHQVDLLHPTNYNLIVTTDLCIYLDEGSYYWWTIEAADNSTQATWIYSNSPFYNIATTEDAGSTWNNQLYYAGAGGVWAEQVFENTTIDGDINFDFTVNILDIISLVSYILGNSFFNEDQMTAADLNHDGVINVIDVVSLVNTILTPLLANPDFVLEDINPASEYHGNDIGPSFFSGQVSCYYFGKQGWSTCRARFGILNDLYNELVEEGITDVKMMGVNGYQYINDSVHCMICDNECTSSSCDSGPRVLPWAQDYDDGLNCQDDNEGLCAASDDTGDVWDLWDINLRDFVILDRYGNEFARVNLTYNNPDPTELGECTENYQKIKDLILTARNR